jgi:hypothetical protein
MLTMDKLCFGAFARTLQPALQKPNSNQAIVGILLDLITDFAAVGQLSENYSLKPGKVSELWNFKSDVHSDVTDLAATDKVIKAMPGAVRKNVIPALIGAATDDLIENLRKLLNADKSIAKEKRDELLALAQKDKLADFLATVYLYSLTRSNKKVEGRGDMETAADLSVTVDDIEKIKEIYRRIPRPKDIEVPDEPENDELTYIAELLAAYAEKTGVAELSLDALAGYRQYREDLRQRRKEYYAAETIRRGTREVFGETDPDQFGILKDETYDGIFDVHSQDYQDGYERLLKVMAHVSSIQINKSPLSKLPEWIGNKEKKGVCHILVNDGVIRWVVRDE